MNKLVVIGLVILGFIIVSFSGCSQIDAGFAGVKTRFGKVVSVEPIGEGLTLYNPISDKVYKYDCRTRNYTATSELYDGDNQKSIWQVSVRYHLDRQYVIELHKTVGKDYTETLFAKPVNDTLKNIVGKIKTDNLVHKREEICKEFSERVNSLLSKRGIIVEQLTIDDIEMPNEYEKAILSKNVALQNKERQKYESEQMVTKASGEAEAEIAKAKGQATAMLEKSKAEAQAIEIKNKALASSHALIEYTYAQNWNGVLPTTMLGNGVIPMMNLNTVKESK